MKRLLTLAMLLMCVTAFAANNDKDTLVVFRSGQGIGSFEIKYIPTTEETRSIKMRLLDAYTRLPLQENLDSLDESDLVTQPNGRGLVRLLRNPGRVSLGIHEIDENGEFEVTDLSPEYTYCITAASSNYGYIAVPFYSSVEPGNIECEILFKKTPISSDVNCDNRVNVSDVTELVNMILGVGHRAELVLGDVNRSGKIDVSDVTALVNNILGIVSQ